MSIKDVVVHLQRILTSSDDDQAISDIKKFQQWVWDSQIEAGPEADNLLNDLALDLEYFDPKETDQPFYGRSKLKLEIESALVKLQSL